jgi:shikimate 5-dehydrogenase
MKHEFVFGLLGSKCSGQIRKVWNAFLKERGVDGFFDFYPTKTCEQLELRLSEMFLLHRRGYVIGEQFQETVIPLLDRLDTSAEKKGAVDTVVNDGGVFVGYWIGDSADARLSLWLAASPVTEF